jgi:hypothetical protein
MRQDVDLGVTPIHHLTIHPYFSIAIRQGWGQGRHRFSLVVSSGAAGKAGILGAGLSRSVIQGQAAYGRLLERS